jgi:hypothetical protein
MRIEATGGKLWMLKVDFISLARGYRFVQAPFSNQRFTLLTRRFLSSRGTGR